MIKDHWDKDRDGDMVIEFADSSVVVEAMKMWLGMDDTIRNVDDAHIEEAFESLSENKRVSILEDYIEEVGLQMEFDCWYEQKYGRDEDSDNAGDYDDDKYDAAKDLEMDFHGLFDTMGLDGEGVQQAWDRLIARGC